MQFKYKFTFSLQKVQFSDIMFLYVAIQWQDLQTYNIFFIFKYSVPIWFSKQLIDFMLLFFCSVNMVCNCDESLPRSEWEVVFVVGCVLLACNTMKTSNLILSYCFWPIDCGMIICGLCRGVLVYCGCWMLACPYYRALCWSLIALKFWTIFFKNRFVTGDISGD